MNGLFDKSTKNNITLSSKSIMDFLFSNNSVSLMKLHDISPCHHVAFPALQLKSPPFPKIASLRQPIVASG